MANGKRVREGECLCGAVRFEVAGDLGEVVACHCSMCRKQTGHFWASTDVRKDALTITESRGLKWFRSSPGIRRGFCGECGSTIFFDRDEGLSISISGGVLEGATGVATRAHIYCADKGDYYEIADGVPQFPASDR
ncbi:GFA family protein [Nisaea sp.]|uniref:GFA family protein n=1 Tax=Nisaea sp. TaxID=2024842 RepID=UPI0025EB62DC|nr:GFA family protein [Nisaea sp.]